MSRPSRDSGGDLITIYEHEQVSRQKAEALDAQDRRRMLLGNAMRYGVFESAHKVIEEQRVCFPGEAEIEM